MKIRWEGSKLIHPFSDGGLDYGGNEKEDKNVKKNFKETINKFGSNAYCNSLTRGRITFIVLILEETKTCSKQI